MKILKTETKIISKEQLQSYRDKFDVIEEQCINSIVIITYKKENVESELKSNVSIAAAITAKARIRLYKGFEDCKKNGGRLLYCDTDSIFAAFTRDVSKQKHGEVV